MNMIIYDNIDMIHLPKLDNEYYIYIIENSSKHIKVGISKDVCTRFNSLSGSNAGGNTLTKFAISEPTYLKTLEKIIHNHFDSNRLKGSEWFTNISFDTVVDYINSLFNSKSYIRCNECRKKAGGYINKHGKSTR